MDTNLPHWEGRFREYLISHLSGNDGSHNAGHFRRVWQTACALAEAEDGLEPDKLTILAAAYFHDIISLPKNDPEAQRSSWLSAQQVALIFRDHFPDFPEHLIAGVQHAIHAHSFSAGVVPQTIEAKLLQDADRMEALGAIGIARVFYTAGRLGTEMFSDADPMASHRALNDRRYALDHFTVKLAKLPALMTTKAGKKMAAQRAAYLQDFMKQLLAEIGDGNLGAQPD